MKNPGIFETLQQFQQTRDNLDPALFVLALAASLGASFFAATLYKIFYERRGTGSQVHRSFPLLGISITTLFISVQISIPLSLGLLGALSIIRFRTPIKEPEEVGFIMLLIASSVSAATFNFRFMLLLLGMALVALILVRISKGRVFPLRDGLLVLQLSDADADQAWPGVEARLKNHLRRLHVESSSSRDGLTSVHLAFSGLRTNVAELQKDLRTNAPVKAMNVFLDRPGGLR